MAKQFLELEFQHKGNKQTKNANSEQNLADFLAATDSEIIIIQILHRKGQIKIWTEMSSLGQESTFKVETRKSQASFKSLARLSRPS